MLTVDQADLLAGGSVLGNSGDDTLLVKATLIDLGSTTLSSVEIIEAGRNIATSFLVDQADLAVNGSVIGSSGSDTLAANSSSIDLSSTSLTSVEAIAAGTTDSTSFILDQGDLAVSGSVIGSSNADTLVASGTSIDLTSATLSSVEVLQAGNTGDTLFTVNQADLAAGGSVVGNSGTDTLATTGASLNFTSTVLASVEILQAAGNSATVFTVDQADLAAGGTVVGTDVSDTLTVKDSTADLTSSTLSSVEILRAGSATATSFVVNQDDLAADGSVFGSSGTDTLATGDATLDLSSTALNSIEVLQADTGNDTVFTVDQSDLAANGSIVGNSGNDQLVVAGTSLNLSSTTLASVETLLAGTNSDTVFTVNQADLASGGFVQGSSGSDTLSIKGSILDLTSTTLDNVETIAAGLNSATTLIVDQADLAPSGFVAGSTGVDTLQASDSLLDLSSTTLTSIEMLRTGSTGSTTFLVDQTDLVSAGSVFGATAADTLAAAGAALDLRSTALSSVEVLQAGTSGDTAFTVDQADLLSGGSVLGDAGNDTLVASAASFNLTSTTLSSVELLQMGATAATTFTIDQADLVSGGSLSGGALNDTLAIKGAAFDLSSTTVSDVEVLKAGVSAATTFTVDQDDLASGGSLIGSTGVDTLAAAGSTLDLSSTTLSSVEVLTAGSTGDTAFTVDQADLAINGSVLGNAGTDTLIINGSSLTLTSATLSSVEVLQAGTTGDTAFSIDAADLASGGSVVGDVGADTLTIKGTAIDLTATGLNSIDQIKAGTATATTFTVDYNDLAWGASLSGSTGTDTLVMTGSDFDLSSATLSSVEVLKAGSSAGTTFTLDQADLVSGGSILGGAGTDTLVAAGSVLNLASVTLSSIEVFQLGGTGDTSFTLGQSDLVPGGTLTGGVGTDTLMSKGTSLNLTSTTLNSIEVLQAGTSSATIFTVDAADLASGGSVVGGAGSDQLVFAGTAADLSSTGISSMETLKAGLTAATTFTVDQADLVSGGVVQGSTATDTLVAVGSTLDLSSTTIRSVEILTAGSAADTVFTVQQADLLSGGSVTGGAGTDTLVAAATSLDLRSTTLSSVEVLQSGMTAGTSFTVDAADLLSGGSVLGAAGVDTLELGSTVVDLRGTSLSSIEIIKLNAGNLSVNATVDASQLMSGGSVLGGAGVTTLTIAGTAYDMTSTTLSSVEVLQAGTSSATVFTVDAGDLNPGGGVTGSSGVDTLVVVSSTFDLRSTLLTSVEVIQAGVSGDTSFSVDQVDLNAGGSVLGSSGNDTLSALGSSLNLSSTTLSSVEALKACANLATVITVDQGDLLSGGSILGGTKSDTLAAAGTALDLTSTTLSSVEVLQVGSTAATTFTVDLSDLAIGGSVLGAAGADTLQVAGTLFDLTATTLSSVEVLQAGVTAATVFGVNAADLASGGSVVGNAGSDVLYTAGSALDLTSTTLSSVETLQAGNAAATTFTVDAADLISGGSVIGSTASDTLVAAGSSLDLSVTTLSSVEVLKAGTSGANVFIVDGADLISNGSVLGSTASDTLTVNGTAFDLSNTTVSSVEVLATAATNGATFTVNAADLASGGSVLGGAGADTLAISGNAFNLLSTTLSSVEVLQAATSAATSFTVDAADLAADGSVVGSSGADTLTIRATTIDLTSTALNSIDVLKAGASTATTFALDYNDLAWGASLQGSSGVDTLLLATTDIDLSSATLTSVEVLKATSASATVFTANQADLAASGSIIGSSGTDTLAAAGSTLDLTSTTLSSIEVLKINGITSTTISVDQVDLANGGSVLGGIAVDTLAAKGTGFNLTSTTLSSVEVLKALTAGTTFTVDIADLVSGGSVLGAAGNDTLLISGTAIDLSSTSLSSVEVLKALSTAATVFTIDAADLAPNGTILGSSGTDTLIVNSTNIDFSSTTLSSVEVLDAGASGATVFTINQADLASIGSVLGSANDDTLTIKGSAVDLGSTTLSSVEILRAGTVGATSFIVDQADLLSGGSVIGSSAADTLAIRGTLLDLTATALSSVENLKANTTAATTFIVDAGDLVSGGSVRGSTGADTLLFSMSTVDLGTVALSSIEVLKANTTAATTFTIDQADLMSGGSIFGSSATDTLIANGNALDLGSVTVTSVEVLQAKVTAATTFSVNQADLAAGGSVLGSSSADTLVAKSATLDLTSTTLSSIEVLKSGFATAVTFSIDQADLVAGGSVSGGTAIDTLIIAGSSLDLISTALTSIEVLKAGTAGDTVFRVDLSDLVVNGSLLGSSGTDTLIVASTNFDVGSTALSSIEVLQAGLSAATTFSVNQADLASIGSVIGSSLTDTLAIRGALLDLTSTTLTGVEVLKAATAGATVFTVDAADLAAGMSVLGGSASDTLTIKDSAFDLSNISLSSIEVLKAGVSAATTFTVDQIDLAKPGSVFGSTGIDTLIVNGTSFDLRSTTLSSVEILQASSNSATVFTLDQADLALNGSILGGSGTDTLMIAGAALNLASTTLGDIEVLKAGTAGATTFTVDMADLMSGGAVIGSSGNDTLVARGVSLDLTDTLLTSVETLKAGNSLATTFTFDQADLAAGSAVIGSTGIDTLIAHGSTLNLASTTLTTIEILKAGSASDTIFTLDQADLAASGSIFGNTGTDTLIANGAALNLTTTTLSSIEILKAGLTSATTFTIDQSDLAIGGSVIGGAGSDVLSIKGSVVDLSNTTLTSIETLVTGNTVATKFIVDDDGEGLKISGGAGADIFQFTSAYGQTDHTSDTTILADTATITNFTVPGNEVIDVSQLTAHGTTSFVAQATTQAAVNAAAPATLSAALNAAAHAIDGSVNSAVTAFQYGGATYVLVDNSGTAGLTTQDQVIKLTGALTLTSTDFVL